MPQHTKIIEATVHDISGQYIQSLFIKVGVCPKGTVKLFLGDSSKMDLKQRC